MLKTTRTMLLLVAVLTGCSAASGPTFNAYSVALPNGEKAFKVDCYGIFEGIGTCRRAAQDICGKQTVHEVEDVVPLGSTSEGRGDTRILTFQCGAKTPPAAPVVVVPPPPPPPPAPPQRITLSGDANFETAQSILTPVAHDRLDRLIGQARGMTFSTVTVNGYTDSVGPVPYNLSLSDRRAQTVADYLKEHGLRAAQFVAHGYGKADPVDSNATVEGRARNRRVEVVLDQN